MAEKQDYPSIGKLGQWESLDGQKDVQKKATEYTDYFDRSKGEEALSARKREYTTVVNHYYDLVTDFYEYGWGQCFHFARRRCDQTFNESIATHEHFLADKIGMKKGDKVLDVGCGVGGPMREMCRYSGASIVGINNNDYQLQRLARHNENAGLSDLCSAVKGDFLHMPFENELFEHAFSLEATCHAPDRVQVYSEVFRTLKPGGRFGVYEWCMTDKYDKNNAEHNEIKHGIEVGDGLPPILLTSEVLDCLKKAGFKIISAEDRADNGPGMIPWYATLAGSWSLSGFRMTWLGRMLTHNLCRVMEFTRLAPTGTVAASQILMDAADSLVAGGKTGIFTPMFLVIAEKPAN